MWVKHIFCQQKNYCGFKLKTISKTTIDSYAKNSAKDDKKKFQIHIYSATSSKPTPKIKIAKKNSKKYRFLELIQGK